MTPLFRNFNPRDNNDAFQLCLKIEYVDIKAH